MQYHLAPIWYLVVRGDCSAPRLIHSQVVMSLLATNSSLLRGGGIWSRNRCIYPFNPLVLLVFPYSQGTCIMISKLTTHVCKATSSASRRSLSAIAFEAFGSPLKYVSLVCIWALYFNLFYPISFWYFYACNFNVCLDSVYVEAPRMQMLQLLARAIKLK